MDDIKPVNGKAPLSKLTNWSYKGMPLDTDTMPGNAGSSWYFLRYMDPNNDQAFCGKDAVEYWQDVDLYVGGTEHAVGHLMYSRFWHKFLYDLGKVLTQEPFKKLINQGMIQGESAFEYKVVNENKFVSYNLKDAYNTIPIHVAITLVNDKGELDLEAVKRWRPEQAEAEFVLEDGKYIVGHEVEKMSKSKHNVVNPDDVIEEYGADCFRMFEMFLGPIENHKPWQTKGIDGVARFLRKFWNLAHNEEGAFILTNEEQKDLIADGEIQANFALNTELVNDFFNFSDLAKKSANTLIFPNLSSGNIAYKLIQEMAKVESIGPLLLGMKKPVHVLQIGSSVREILNVVSIAVTDAQR